jgi:uncharacterized protein YbbC (DUF1343 family)
MWGIDRLNGGQLSGLRKRLRNGPLALLTHSPAIDRRGRQTLDVLSELGAQPRVVFTPEHGLYGTAQAEEPVANEEASDNKPALVSLYGTDAASLTPTAEHLEGLETLVIDLVDIGSRYYTYVWTALLAARAALASNVHVVVLDRPNPLSGNPSWCEGIPQDPEYTSFVGWACVPVRHGLTVAELLLHCLTNNGDLSIDQLGAQGRFSVVSCWGWERNRLADAWGRPFVPPSPNMPSLETALLYPGGCLVEGTNLSEGRGTALPFRVYGAPFLNEDTFAAALREAHLPGVLFRPAKFRPSFEKHAGTVCKGVMLHVTEPHVFRPIHTMLTLIGVAIAQAPEAFEFLTRVYEFDATRPAFDLLTGSSKARLAFMDGASGNDVADWLCPVAPGWSEQLQAAQDLASRAQA